MITLILPGYSASNKEWADEVAKNLKVEGEIRPVYWDHWEDENQPFNVAEKVSSLTGLIVKQKVNIIAKSAGIAVAVGLIKAIPDQIQKVIICGLPYKGGTSERIEEYKKAFAGFPAEKMIFFQNEKDPLGPFTRVSSLLAQVNPQIEVVSLPRSDHYYPYYKEFQKFISS